MPPFLGEHGVQKTALPHSVDLEVLEEEPLLSHAYLLHHPRRRRILRKTRGPNSMDTFQDDHAAEL